MPKLTKVQSYNLLILLNLISGYIQSADIPELEFVERQGNVVVKLIVEFDEFALLEEGFEFTFEDPYYLIAL